MHRKLYKRDMDLVPRLVKLAQTFNCFYLESYRKNECKPFIVDGHQVGLVRKDVIKALEEYPEVFQIRSNSVVLNPAFRDYSERTKKLECVLKQYREQNRFIALKGWRDEYFEIKPVFSSEPLLKMDRSATYLESVCLSVQLYNPLGLDGWLAGLFGVCKYGVDITGYIRHPEKGICVWLQKRAPTKQTWPRKWDSMVSGGLSEGFGVLETALKEAQEEASVPQQLLDKVTSAGCVSFFFESCLGLFPNTEFVYDLELPLDFVPTNNDGEVETFKLVSVEELTELLFSTDFKTTSCPVVVDFLIRHGLVSPENQPDYPKLVELLHVPLQSLYRQNNLVNGTA